MVARVVADGVGQWHQLTEQERYTMAKLGRMKVAASAVEHAALVAVVVVDPFFLPRLVR